MMLINFKLRRTKETGHTCSQEILAWQLYLRIYLPFLITTEVETVSYCIIPFLVGKTLQINIGRACSCLFILTQHKPEHYLTIVLIVTLFLDSSKPYTNLDFFPMLIPIFYFPWVVPNLL